MVQEPLLLIVAFFLFFALSVVFVRMDFAITKAWLPDGYSQIFRIICVWPFGLLDYGSATLRRKI